MGVPGTTVGAREEMVPATDPHQQHLTSARYSIRYARGVVVRRRTDGRLGGGFEVPVTPRLKVGGRAGLLDDETVGPGTGWRGPRPAVVSIAPPTGSSGGSLDGPAPKAGVRRKVQRTGAA